MTKQKDRFMGREFVLPSGATAIVIGMTTDGSGYWLNVFNNEPDEGPVKVTADYLRKLKPHVAKVA